MNKKTIITALLALVAVLIVFIILIGHKQDTKKVAKTSKVSKDSVEAMKQNDDVLTYDISSMQDVTSGLTIVIREYNQQGMTDEKSLPEFGEGNTIPKSLSIGFSRKQSDSIVTVTLRSDHQDSSQWNLILKSTSTRKYHIGFHHYQSTLSFPLSFTAHSGGIQTIKCVASVGRRN